MARLAHVLDHALSAGTVEVRTSRGALATIARSDEPHISVELKRPGMAIALGVDPSYYLPKFYVDGSLTIEGTDLRGLLSLLMTATPDDQDVSFMDRLRRLGQPLADAFRHVGSMARVRGDVQFHYDLSNAFFEAFLDPDLQYSCAYFDPWDTDLATAQQRKMAHIAAKLDVRPNAKVLDIGCGWGGLGAYLSRRCRAHVTGLTISRNQASYARERWTAEHLDIRLEDYRVHHRCYDRIVSVGMLEHVGRGRYDEYFAKVRSLLSEDGIALVHTIGRRGPPAAINPWIRRHVFPGSYLPSLSELVAAVERQGLWLTDCENIRHHYARTLAFWRRAIEARKPAIVAEYGERFYRGWEFYLTASELGFLHQGLTVYQLVLARTATAAPLTRRYMFEAEEKLRAGENPSP